MNHKEASLISRCYTEGVFIMKEAFAWGE